MSENLPLLASGILVKDYTPLYKYWEKAEKAGLKKLVIESDDIRFVEEIVRREGAVNLNIIYRELLNRIEKRVDEKIAVNVYKDMGFNFPPLLAKRKIAEIVVGWIIEACDTFNIVKIRRRNNV